MFDPSLRNWGVDVLHQGHVPMALEVEGSIKGALYPSTQRSGLWLQVRPPVHATSVVLRNRPMMSTESRGESIKDRQALPEPSDRLVPTLPEHRPRADEETLHLTRYVFAARYVHGVVLDIGCGRGYGSRYLLQAGRSQVIGVDLSPGTVQYAVAHYDGPSFVVANGHALPFRTSTFSSVVCLETIEFVHDPETFLQELSRVVQSGGRVILSTPNHRGGTFLSHSHMQEFRHEELHALLSKVFQGEIAWFGQFDVAQPGWILTILRSIVDSVVARDKSNLRLKLLPYRLRDAILRYVLGIRDKPDDIFPWKPTCLYQIAVLEKGV